MNLKAKLEKKRKSASVNYNSIIEDEFDIDETISYSNLSDIPSKFIENHIPVDKVIVDENYRKTMSEESIKDLASSIEKFGLLNPIIVIEMSEGKYLLCAGGRRIEALKTLSIDTLPKASVYPNKALPFHKAMMYADNFEREDVALSEILDGIEEAFNEAYKNIEATEENIDAIKRRLDDAIKDMGQFAGIPKRLFSMYSKLSQAYLLKNKKGAYLFPTFRKMIKQDIVSDKTSLYDISIALLDALGTKRENSVSKKLNEMFKGTVKDTVRNNAIKLKKFAQGKTAKSGIVSKEKTNTETPKEGKREEEATAKSAVEEGVISPQKVNLFDRAILQFERYIDSLNGDLSENDKELLVKINSKLEQTPRKIARLLEVET